MFRVPAGTEMTPSLLAKYMTKHKNEIATRYQKLHDAYENDYEIDKLPAKEVYKPDNRIPVNFAKYITDTMNGFFIGVPIKTTSDDENVNKYLEFLDQYNDQDDNNAELSKMCSIYGKGYEMYYNDAESNVAITYLSPMDAFMIYDESILERPLFFVRHYLDSNNVERGSWSDGNIVQHFVMNGSYHWVGEPEPHYFDGVPATEYVENRERMGIFESVLPMIDAYNKAISEKANDVDYFADAYLKVFGPKIESGDTAHIRSTRLINFEGDAEEISNIVAEFMEKPNADGSQENLLDRLEKLIFQISMVANISDENFGSSTGIALKYKLLNMSNLAKTKERKFRSGMNRRYKLIFSNPASGMQKDAWVGINCHFTQNFPANISDEADTAEKLEGIVSKETQLKTLSIVDNVQGEMEQIQEEENQKTEYTVLGKNESSVLEMINIIKEYAERNGEEPVDVFRGLIKKGVDENEEQ